MSPAAGIATVVVTGASGYIGTEVTKQLLEKGYNVRATVRSPDNAEKVAHLNALGAALPGRLELFAADLLEEGSFDAAVSGADVVFHTASPFFTEVTDPQKQLVDPAVMGTRNVLDSIVKNRDSVRRVVLTSSVAAVRSTKTPAPPTNGSLYTEEDWNEQSTLENEPYPLSKVLAEKEAWKLAKEHKLDLVVINPVFVIGPVLSARTDATSIKLLKGVLEGEKTAFNSAALRYIDVRDVARAHVLAAEQPSAQGRYILSHPNTVPAGFVTDALQAAFPKLAGIQVGGAGEIVKTIDNTKVTQGLGLRLIPEQQSFKDMATTLIQLGIAKPSFA